ncbi:hypothetical protein ILUMI_16697, partial [Ignelater luminosus]
MPKVPKRGYKKDREKENWAKVECGAKFAKRRFERTATICRHAKSQSHIQKMGVLHPRLDRQKTLPFRPTLTVSQKETDLKLAMFIAVHSGMNSADHLCEILQVDGKGSNLEKVKLHRTKCSNIIK